MAQSYILRIAMYGAETWNSAENTALEEDGGCWLGISCESRTKVICYVQ